MGCIGSSIGARPAVTASALQLCRANFNEGASEFVVGDVHDANGKDMPGMNGTRLSSSTIAFTVGDLLELMTPLG